MGLKVCVCGGGGGGGAQHTIAPPIKKKGGGACPLPLLPPPASYASGIFEYTNCHQDGKGIIWLNSLYNGTEITFHYCTTFIFASFIPITIISMFIH